MKLKTCSCGKDVTTKNALKNKHRRGEFNGMGHLVFTCPECFSSFYIFDEAAKRLLEAYRAKRGGPAFNILKVRAERKAK